MAPKLTVYQVVYSRHFKDWALVQGNINISVCRTKKELLARLKRLVQEPATVRIRGKDGRFQQERTYPRGLDPRRSRG
jgi:hypothetical protein